MTDHAWAAGQQRGEVSAAVMLGPAVVVLQPRCLGNNERCVGQSGLPLRLAVPLVTSMGLESGSISRGHWRV